MPATKYPHELTADESTLVRVELRVVIKRILRDVHRDVQEGGLEATKYNLSRLDRCATLHAAVAALGGQRYDFIDEEIERLRALLPSQTV